MTQRLSNPYAYSTTGKRRQPSDHPDAAQNPHAESLHVLALTQELAALDSTAQVQAFMARLQPEFLSRHPGLLLAVANAATRWVGEDADLLEHIARQCLQATQLMPEPSGADAVAVWQSLIAQLRGLQGRLARTLLHALESFPLPETARPAYEQACQAASACTLSAPQTLQERAPPPADLAGTQSVQIGSPGFKWPMEIMALVARFPASGLTPGTMTAFYRELNHCLTWMLVDKRHKEAQQPRLEALLRDWVSQCRPPARASTPAHPKAFTLGMLHIYNFSCLAHKSSGRGKPLFLALDEATQSDAPRQLQTLLPYLWTQACLEWMRPTDPSLLLMGKRVLAQVQHCSLAVQRRLLVGLAYGGDNALREEALQRLSQIEAHPGFQQRLRAAQIARCLSPARLSSEDIDAVLLDLEQTPADQVTELGYLRQLVKVSQQPLSQAQRERALHCTLVLRRFEAHCDRLGVPQTAHQSIYYELGQQLPTLASQAYAQLERQQL